MRRINHNAFTLVEVLPSRLRIRPDALLNPLQGALPDNAFQLTIFLLQTAE